ncbi:hypothetical protein, partial [Phocaeicola vulgatus]|uniref:hypothetical protein n=1 Tax=Phocaeicola vulgatus TaxID=821 RepID=UPI001C024DB4
YKGHYTYPMVAQFSTGILAHFSISIYTRKYGLSVWPNPFGRVNKPFFPVCLLWVTACPIYGRAVTCSFPLPAQKNSKRKKSQKIRKSTFVA